MRIRGDLFWAWADPTLHHRTHPETLSDGTTIDIQVRLSRSGVTQVFMGIYAASGMALHEEAHDERPGQSMTRALASAVAKARQLALQQACAGPVRVNQSTPSALQGFVSLGG
jgi:hypothetical protein